MAWNWYLWVKKLNLVEAEVMRNKLHILSLRIKTIEFSFPFRSFFISIFCLLFFYPLDLDKVTLACFKTSQFSVCVSSLPSDNQLVAGKKARKSFTENPAMSKFTAKWWAWASNSFWRCFKFSFMSWKSSMQTCDKGSHHSHHLFCGETEALTDSNVL